MNEEERADYVVRTTVLVLAVVALLLLATLSYP